MAASNFLFFEVAALFLVASSAAPSQDVNSGLPIPLLCRNQRFCSIKPKGYDLLEEKINNALPQFLLKAFADQNGEEPLTEEPILSPEEDWHNCPYETKTLSLYLYNHGGNNTKTEIFVQTKLFRQYVDFVTCATKYIETDSDEQCFQDLRVSAFGMKSTCETTSAQRTLYVFDIETGKVIQKAFEVPACCKCKVSNVI